MGPDLDELLRLLDRPPSAPTGSRPSGPPASRGHRAHASSPVGDGQVPATAAAGSPDKVEANSGNADSGNAGSGNAGSGAEVNSDSSSGDSGVEPPSAGSGSRQDDGPGSDTPQLSEEGGEGRDGQRPAGASDRGEGSGSGGTGTTGVRTLGAARVNAMLEQLLVLQCVLWDHISKAIERGCLPDVLVSFRQKPQHNDPTGLAVALYRLLRGCTHIGMCDQRCTDVVSSLLPPKAADGRRPEPAEGTWVDEGDFARLTCAALSKAEVCARALRVWLPTTPEMRREYMEACKSIADGHFCVALVGAIVAPVRPNLVSTEQRQEAAELASAALRELRATCEDMGKVCFPSKHDFVTTQEAVIMATLERGAVAALRAADLLLTDWGADWSRGDGENVLSARGDAIAVFQYFCLDPLQRLLAALTVQADMGWELLLCTLEGVWCVPLSTLLGILTHQLQMFTAAGASEYQQSQPAAALHFAGALQSAVDLVARLRTLVSGPGAAEVRVGIRAIVTSQVEEGLPVVKAVQSAQELLRTHGVFTMVTQLTHGMLDRCVRHQQQQVAYAAIGELVDLIRQPHLTMAVALHQVRPDPAAKRQILAADLLCGLLDARGSRNNTDNGTLCFRELLTACGTAQRLILVSGVSDMLSTFASGAVASQASLPPWLAGAMRVVVHMYARQAWQPPAHGLSHAVPNAADGSTPSADLATLLKDVPPSAWWLLAALPKTLHLPAWDMAVALFKYVCQGITSEAKKFVPSKKSAWRAAHGQKVLLLVPCLTAVLRLMTYAAADPQLTPSGVNFGSSALIEALPLKILTCAPTGDVLMPEIRASVVALMGAITSRRAADTDTREQ